MKRSIALSLVLGLVACGGDADNGSSDDKNQKLRVGFVNFQENSVWRAEFARSVQAEADKRGYELVFRNGTDESQQSEDIEALAAMDLDALFIAPKVVSLASAVNAASKATLPIILLDRGVDNTVSIPGVNFLTLISHDFT